MVKKGAIGLMEFIYDIEKMALGIQNPCKALFLRFFLLKSIKELMNKEVILGYI